MPKTFIITLDDEQVRLMEDMVSDIESWLKAGPLVQKCNNHRGRLAKIMRDRLTALGTETIPTDERVLSQMYFDDVNYKNRKQREEEERLEALKRLG